jgi:hypothetical protein
MMEVYAHRPSVDSSLCVSLYAPKIFLTVEHSLQRYILPVSNLPPFLEGKGEPAHITRKIKIHSLRGLELSGILQSSRPMFSCHFQCQYNMT